MYERKFLILPGVIVVLSLIYSAYWFSMAGVIRSEVENWIEDQKQDGTSVTYGSFEVKGFPYRLEAHFKNPVIDASGHPNKWRWQGDYLIAIAQPWSLNHIILDFMGEQQVSLQEDLGPIARPPTELDAILAGKALQASLLLRQGKVNQIDIDFHDPTIVTRSTGDYVSGDFAQWIDREISLERLLFHTRFRQNDDSNDIFQDTVVNLENISMGEDTPDGFDSAIKSVHSFISVGNAGNNPLREGRVGAAPNTTDDHRDFQIHAASIDWQPMSLHVAGNLRGRKLRDSSGRVKLTIDGHDDLVRLLEDQGELSPAAAVASGAILGAVSAIAGNEDGAIEVPLKVKSGEISLDLAGLLD